MIANSAAVVTGGTKGLGRALALELARAGVRVLATFHADGDAAEQVARELAAIREGCDVVAHDVGGEPLCLPAWSPEKWILVNNAWPSFVPRPFHLTPAEDVEASLRTGFIGAWSLIQRLVPEMVRGGGGTIVNVLSSAMLEPSPPRGFSAYVAIKRAVAELGRAIAVEYGRRGVRVLGVAPPFMETAMTSAWPPAVRAAQTETTQPETVARETVALISDATLPGQGEIYPVPNR